MEINRKITFFQDAFPFFLLTLLLGAIGYIPWVLASYNLIPGNIIFPFMILGGGSPTFAMLIYSKHRFGKRGQKAVFHGITRKVTSKFSTQLI